MKKKETRNADLYPGANTDKADKGKVTKKEVRQEVRILNNNPRITDIDMP